MFTRLFVGNLSFQATAENVRERFQPAGTVGAVRSVRSANPARPGLRAADLPRAR